MEETDRGCSFPRARVAQPSPCGLRLDKPTTTTSENGVTPAGSSAGACRLNFGSASRARPVLLSTMRFHYVYILQGAIDSDHFYVGLTDDLQERLRQHNAGEVAHTAKFRPWVIKTAIAFRDRERASAFERYLKSGSGRASARKHF